MPQSLVDPPGPMTSRKTLNDFLERAKAWPTNDPNVRSAVARVKGYLQLRDRGEVPEHPDDQR